MIRFRVRILVNVFLRPFGCVLNRGLYSLIFLKTIYFLVMDETNCHIHFPDSNRGSVSAEKSNQVRVWR